MVGHFLGLPPNLQLWYNFLRLRISSGVLPFRITQAAGVGRSISCSLSMKTLKLQSPFVQLTVTGADKQKLLTFDFYSSATCLIHSSTPDVKSAIAQ
jgi:hypothetical protein